MHSQAPYAKSCAYSFSRPRDHQTTDLQDKHHDLALQMPTNCGTRVIDRVRRPDRLQLDLLSRVAVPTQHVVRTRSENDRRAVGVARPRVSRALMMRLPHLLSGGREGCSATLPLACDGCHGARLIEGGTTASTSFALRHREIRVGGPPVCRARDLRRPRSRLTTTRGGPYGLTRPGVADAGRFNVPTNAAAPELSLRGHADIKENLNVDR